MQSTTGLKNNVHKAFLEVFEKAQNHTLSELRAQAQAHVNALDLPTKRHEEWKYTSLEAVYKTDFKIQIERNEDEASFLEHCQKTLPITEEAHHLVFVNGHFSPKSSLILPEGKGIRIEPMASVIRQDSEWLTAHLDNYTTDAEDAIFTALNTAYFTDGALIHVPRATELSYPVVLHFLSDARAVNSLAQVRNLMIVGENSRLKVIENFIGIGDYKHLSNSVTEIAVAPHAHVDHYKMQIDESLNYHVGTTYVRQADESSFSNTTISLTGDIVRNDLKIKLGERCESYMNGLYMLKGKTHVDNHTAVDHAKPHSESHELYKGILDGQSRGVFNGKIFVRQDAQKTNAFQSNRNIVLSDKAAIDTKPQLEIWADDVKCSHGATTGKIDTEALFYLQSRGISKKKAQAMMVQAFAKEVTERIAFESLREFLALQIEHRLS
ncbi:MAG: Fe-S cluster assembly protein SufD [Bernardetiaceae bacterium]|nr:Fe-S cluster assembly protein SufD [Bernardetiaceae bacterium]